MRFDAPTAEEYPLIFDSWARSFMKSPWAGCTRNCDWDHVSRAASSEIVDRPTTRVTVLVTDTESGERRVIGYSVSEPSRGILHWLYVKRDYRGMGHGRRLLTEVIGNAPPRTKWVYTYRTNASEKFLRGMKHDRRHACVKA
jgi:ribosomal protein S18 acetylase RimI-like enzyme